MFRVILLVTLFSYVRATACSFNSQTEFDSSRMCMQAEGNGFHGDSSATHYNKWPLIIMPKGARRAVDGRYKPRCITAATTNQKYCVFTNSTFANGRGISIFSTSGQARAILKLAAIEADIRQGQQQQQQHQNQVAQEPSPYTIQEVAGHGIGVVANRSIARGDVIMSTSPIVMLHDDIFTHFSDKQRLQIQHLAVGQLPEASKESYMSLQGQFGGDVVLDILDTNSFGVNLFQVSGMGTPYTILVPEIAVGS
jgi:hypothetical protein